MKRLSVVRNSLTFRDVARVEVSFSVSVHRPLNIFSLFRATICSLNTEQCIWMIKRQFSTKNIGHVTVTPVYSNKRLLIVDGDIFWSLSCQQSGNIVLKNHPDCWKKFRMNCVIPYQWIFQRQRRHREDWSTNYLETHLAPLPGFYYYILYHKCCEQRYMLWRWNRRW